MDTTMTAMISIFIVLSYCIGAVPIIEAVCWYWGHVNIREGGTKKSGATNIARTTKNPILTAVSILIDGGFKGLIWMTVIHFVVRFGFHLHWVAFACFAALILGNIFPVFTKFNSPGSGVAVIVGGSLSLYFGSPVVWAIVAWCLMFHFSGGIKALCNITLVSVLLFSGALYDFTLAATIFAGFGTILTLLGHRSNLIRIVKGEEERSTWESMGKTISEHITKLIAFALKRR